jgi:hypothetical protein
MANSDDRVALKEVLKIFNNIDEILSVMDGATPFKVDEDLVDIGDDESREELLRQLKCAYIRREARQAKYDKEKKKKRFKK